MLYLQGEGVGRSGGLLTYLQFLGRCAMESIQTRVEILIKSKV
jgi:hypothetical protein